MRCTRSRTCVCLLYPEVTGSGSVIAGVIQHKPTSGTVNGPTQSVFLIIDQIRPLDVLVTAIDCSIGHFDRHCDSASADRQQFYHCVCWLVA